MNPLAASREAGGLYRRFRRRGIAVRRFPNFPDLLRITLPGDEATFRRVLRVLDMPFDDSRGEDSDEHQP
ncbi:hypothetical protein [Candidatus Palauibacter sp.]|uniref:hypothetical protein n=1 Tax=Candidatus Palauibacter sp. TaxID=3101350 RepID=UPI003AF209F9